MEMTQHTFNLQLCSQRVKKQSPCLLNKLQCHDSALPAPAQTPAPPPHLPPLQTPVIQTQAKGPGQMGQEAPQDRTLRPPCPTPSPFAVPLPHLTPSPHCRRFPHLTPPPTVGELALQGGGM